MKVAPELRWRIARLLELKRVKAKKVEDYIRELRGLSTELIKPEKLRKAAALFDALSDPINLMILKLLKAREMCVCELVIALDMMQPAISYHLKTLRGAGLVKSHRRGKWIFYSISDRNLLKLIERLIAYI